MGGRRPLSRQLEKGPRRSAGVEPSRRAIEPTTLGRRTSRRWGRLPATGAPGRPNFVIDAVVLPADLAGTGLGVAHWPHLVDRQQATDQAEREKSETPTHYT